MRQRWRLSSVPHGPLARDATVDVLAVGAGISGAFMAEALSDAGLEVLVVDRRGPVATPAQAKANQRV